MKLPFTSCWSSPLMGKGWQQLAVMSGSQTSRPDPHGGRGAQEMVTGQWDAQTGIWISPFNKLSGNDVCSMYPRGQRDGGFALMMFTVEKDSASNNHVKKPDWQTSTWRKTSGFYETIKQKVRLSCLETGAGLRSDFGLERRVFCPFPPAPLGFILSPLFRISPWGVWGGFFLPLVFALLGSFSLNSFTPF